jgi:hypothetical protein
LTRDEGVSLKLNLAFPLNNCTIETPKLKISQAKIEGGDVGDLLCKVF